MVAPALKAQSLNHWSSREVPCLSLSSMQGFSAFVLLTFVLMVLCFGGYPVYCRVFSSILGLCPLMSVSSNCPLSVVMSLISPDIPGEPKSVLLRTSALMHQFPPARTLDSFVISAPGAWKATKAVNRSPTLPLPPVQVACAGSHSSSSSPANAGRCLWPSRPESLPSQRADSSLSQATLDQNTYSSGSPGSRLETHIAQRKSTGDRGRSSTRRGKEARRCLGRQSWVAGALSLPGPWSLDGAR